MSDRLCTFPIEVRADDTNEKRNPLLSLSQYDGRKRCQDVDIIKNHTNLLYIEIQVAHRHRWNSMAERGLSRLEMMLAVLVVVLLVATIASAYLFYAERDKPKDVEAGEGIAQIAFVREGVVVELDQAEQVDTLTLFDAGGDEISEVAVGKEVTRVLADLDWVPYMKYRFDVKLASADVFAPPSFSCSSMANALSLTCRIQLWRSRT
jgi:hypothetical protein